MTHERLVFWLLIAALAASSVAVAELVIGIGAL